MFLSRLFLFRLHESPRYLATTDRASLHKTYQTIKSSMPPIAGLAQGAMVLRDAKSEIKWERGYLPSQNPHCTSPGRSHVFKPGALDIRLPAR